MKFVVAILILFITIQAQAQSGSLSGRVVNEDNKPIYHASITTWQRDSAKHTTTTNKDGAFLFSLTSSGKYYISIKAPGYEPYADSVDIEATEQIPGYSSGAVLGIIKLTSSIHMLDEVKIVEKVLAMVQKDDTLEFNSGAYKVNPDADAADLVGKMPAITINDKQISAQGEAVVKILVDGKPFFGTDPWATLKNLPADIIAKVQVYNEKSDQEQFTGFSEGATSKTINIITKPGKRNGLFGKLYAGGGGDPNTITQSSSDMRYGTGATLNNFAGDRRITLTLQANNVNTQNFTDNASGSGGGSGMNITHAAGLNYSDKWGKKADVSGSYFYNQNTSSLYSQVHKTYLIATDSGQVYNEYSPTASENQSHRFNVRVNYTIDSMNSLLISPSGSVSASSGNNSRTGNTTLGADTVNFTSNTGNNKSLALSLSNTLLFRHRFQKKGRTISLNLNTSTGNNDGTNYHYDTTRYYTGISAGDTLNQRSGQQSLNQSVAATLNYTEPVGEKGQLKLEYNYTYAPASSDKNTYDYSVLTHTYNVLNDQYSNTFHSDNNTHKVGASYLLHITKELEVSAGLNYQFTGLDNTQQQPLYYHLVKRFENLLPVATLHYKLSKSRYLNCNYNTSTQPPGINQLQNVVNNADPLHLYTGNTGLLQPFRHNLSLRYNSSGKEAKSTFSASLSGTLSQHNITSNSIIAAKDSSIGNIPLHAGSQLSYPSNIEGSRSVGAYLYYGMPLGWLKSRLNINVNTGLSRNPSLINNLINYQENRNGSLGLSINSNYSENIDFSLSYNASITANSNSINTRTSASYFSQNTHAAVNLQSHSGFVFNTTLSYQANSGLSSGYDKNYVICNFSLGKKVFSRHQGDIRISVFDLLNQNNNIQHSVTDTYIQDSRTNMLQRYILLIFNYKISDFKSSPIGEKGH